MTRQNKARADERPAETTHSEPRETPAIEVTAKGDDHNTVVIRERAINLRDNLPRVCDGDRLARARDLVSRAVAVALGKD